MSEDYEKKYNNISLPMRKIDLLVKKRAKVKLYDGRIITGKGIFTLYLPINDDSDEDDEFLRFITDDGTEEYFLEEDIESYAIIDN